MPCPNLPDHDAHPLQRFMYLYLRRSIREMNRLLQELHLSMPQMGTLHYLNAEGEQSVSAIAEHLNLSLAATSHLVERLVRRGLLTRREDPHDRRHKQVGLAEDGLALVRRVNREAAASFEAMVQPVPAELKARLEQDLRELNTILGSTCAPRS